MTKEEYDRLIPASVPTIFVDLSMIWDKLGRTLLWGYTTERYSWHVYLQSGEIHHVVYDWNGKVHSHVSGIRFEAEGLVPNKRLYPEACDAQFCNLLLGHGIRLPFTAWNDERLPQQFHGRIIVDGSLSPKQLPLRNS